MAPHLHEAHMSLNARILVALTSLAAFAVLAGGGIVLRAQEGQTPLRSETVFVQVDVYVSDERGIPISDLSADDFEVREDGEAKSIQAFQRVDIPLPTVVRGPSTAPSPDRAPMSASEGRRYVLVLDDLHVAPAHSDRVRSALIAFIDTAIGPRDVAAVSYSSGPRHDFTGDKAVLRSEASRFAGRKLRAAAIEKLQDPRVNFSGRVPVNADPFESERAHRAQTTFDLLAAIGEQLSPESGRRTTLVFVSEGFDLDEPGRGGRGASVFSATRDMNRALGALSRANVVVYTIDPRGNPTGAEGLIESSTIFEQQGLGVGGTRREMLRGHEVLTPISANTGGTLLLWRPDMAPAIARVLRESSQYYVLGYAVSTMPSRPAFRRLEVRVKRPGARVAARSGYLPTP
jgi:VWFA-related protein